MYKRLKKILIEGLSPEAKNYRKLATKFKKHKWRTRVYASEKDFNKGEDLAKKTEQAKSKVPVKFNREVERQIKDTAPQKTKEYIRGKRFVRKEQAVYDREHSKERKQTRALIKNTLNRFKVDEAAMSGASRAYRKAFRKWWKHSPNEEYLSDEDWKKSRGADKVASKTFPLIPRDKKRVEVRSKLPDKRAHWNLKKPTGGPNRVHRGRLR